MCGAGEKWGKFRLGGSRPVHCAGVNDVVGGPQIHLPISPPPPIFRGSPRPGWKSTEACGVRGGGEMGKVPSRGLLTPSTRGGRVTQMCVSYNPPSQVRTHSMVGSQKQIGRSDGSKPFHGALTDRPGSLALRQDTQPHQLLLID